MTDRPSSSELPHSRRTAELEEISFSSGPARAVYDQTYGALQMQAGYAARVRDQAQRLMEELGVTSLLYTAKNDPDHVVPFDPFPRVIDNEEWRFLRKAALQRVAVWNAFFRDVYDSQEILKSGIVPFQIVYDDPRYQRAAVGVQVPRDIYVHIAGIDFARNAQGQWVVVDDSVSNPTGMSYAMQARHVLRQTCSDLMDLAEITSLNPFPTDLLEHVRSFAAGGSVEPRVVMISAGVYDETHYENTFLARQMGIPLVRGGDLIVLNDRVYFKTISGLEPIDVIYCRMDDCLLDPVSLRNDSTGGVPGLMTCVRKGTVSIINAAGTGVGDNRALMAFLPQMAKFYLGESLLIPSVKRYWLADHDRCEAILSSIGEYVIFRSVETDGLRNKWDCATLSDGEIAGVQQMILDAPHEFTAESRCANSKLPAVNHDLLDERHCGLRVFAFGGRDETRQPVCALTRYAIEKGSNIISTGLGGGIKDTWVLKGDEPAPMEPIISFAMPQRRIRLGSRIAENLYWIGRYIERAENTTRISRVILDIQSDEQARRNPQEWYPLWEAMATATGHPTNFFKKQRFIRRNILSHYIMLDRANASSVANCVQNVRNNALGTREAVTPELWAIIQDLDDLFDEAHVWGAQVSTLDMIRMQDFQDRVLSHFDALAGCAAKTMLHNDAWHFLQMGIFIERAVTTLLVTRQLLAKKYADENAHRPDTGVEILLRMLSSLYAYRSLYQSRPTAQRAAGLLLQDADVPRSVLFCLEQIEYGLKSVFGKNRRDETNTPLKVCQKLKARVDFADLQEYFQSAAQSGGKPASIGKFLDELSTDTTGLAVVIADYYLHHQAFNVMN
ncbi:circularly permuted type 2 ATP-grasp protein [Oscillatoria amoena NRMC-F 0135]|nr:circularly permuted type 2 ATP-grasp protein [Oscillatoria laete-virens]MDL5048020.1 circularly permuted type 2 ATP-grasp protein [Oscillatoria amoena NRMC-F 0135]MDL5052503.1 circularly permuted type 2 ATP-grasp protein [Oscillatoria laete-virens NRMC-F 0139]